jgi:hypothetical protein
VNRVNGRYTFSSIGDDLSVRCALIIPEQIMWFKFWFLRDKAAVPGKGNPGVTQAIRK